MAQIKQTGATNPFLQSITKDFDPVRGWIFHSEYSGASQAQMDAEQASFVNSGVACRQKYNRGGTAMLDVDDSTQVYVVDNWELVGNELGRDIFDHPTIRAMNLSSSDTRRLREAVLDPTSNWATVYATFDDKTNGPTLEIFFSLYLRGTTDYERSQYVLRHTTNVSNRWTTNIADFGVDTIYTPAQFITEISSGALWNTPCFSSLVFAISNLPAVGTEANYAWGWRKKSSTRTTEANNRVRISQEYVYEQWSTALYAH